MEKNLARNLKIREKKTLSGIALILVLTLSGLFAFIPLANAHTPPWTIDTYAFISAEPNPVGIGQTCYVNFWIDKVPPASVGSYGVHWHNMTVTMTKPDGATQTLGPFDSDAVGGIWTQFIADQVGTYKFVGHFPGQVATLENPYPYTVPLLTQFTYAYLNDTYLPSTSKEVTVTVQQEQITTAFPSNPLPDGYWQRPINSMNRNWYSLGGNWLGLSATQFGLTGDYSSNDGNFNAYTTAPNSAHVLWTLPLAFGGQIGGAFGDSETGLYATGTAYETKFGAVVLYGILYYTEYPGAQNDPVGLKAVDMRTGQTIWEKPITTPLKAGMVYNMVSGDQYGGHAYLFCAPGAQGFVNPTGSNWEMYDAMTGAYVLSIANVTNGILSVGPSGELLSYSITNGKMTMWNSTKCIGFGSAQFISFSNYSPDEIWRPAQGATIDWNYGNQWTVPIATDIAGAEIGAGGLAVTKVSDGVVLLTAVPSLYNGGVPGGSQTGWRVDAGYSANDGHLMWGPINRTLTPWTNKPLGPAAEGVYTEYTCQDLSWTAYSIATGDKLWGPTQSYNSSWGYYDNNAKGVIGYGNLYVWGLSGEVYCYDVQTGIQKWSWYAGSAGIDTPYGTWPLGTWSDLHLLADGKLYVRAGHDYTPPVFRGAKLYCLDANTGVEIWSSLSFNICGSPVVADGIMLWFNGYDNQVYAYGKGQTATTITGPQNVQPLGTSVLIQGTVTDQSPGQTCLGIPAAGTPAISDASMSAWMEYLYQQQPKPADATGVQVHLTAIDPNGNFQDIGYVTSDAKGMYSTMWKPPVEGKYVVTASFEGSESYYTSSSEVAIGVEAGAASVVTPSPSPTSAVQPPTSGIPTMTYVAIAAAVIIIIAAAALLILRRRQ